MTEKLLRPSLPPNPEEISDELLKAAWAYQDVTDLYHFGRNTLGFDKLRPKPHADLSDFITNSGKYEGRLANKWKLILLPRGTYKTTVACQAYPLWLLLRDPNLRILLDGETYAKSAITLRAIKGLITTNGMLRDLHGALNEPISQEACAFAKANRGLTWNEDEVLIGTRTDFSRKEGSISVAGVDIVRVGMHYDVVIGDYYHSEKNVTTREQIEKVTQHIQLMTAILDPGATYIIIGTRWDDKDAYGWIIDEVESLAIREPGIYKGKTFDIMVYPWKLPNGSLFAPEIINEEVMAKIKTMMTPYQISCQYMNDPIDNETAIFKLDWIKNNVLRGKDVAEFVDKMIVFTAVDPAIGEGQEHDYSAIVTMGYVSSVDDEGEWNTKRILLDCHYGHWNPDKLVDEVVEVARKWKPLKIRFEGVSGFKAYESIFNERMRQLKRRIPIVFEPADNTKAKVVKSGALAPMFQYGNFYTVKGARGSDEFIEEYRRFPRAKHDDVLDALADVEKFAYFPNERFNQIEEPYKPLDETTGY